jgi:murein L,D-transpeptidase YafK
MPSEESPEVLLKAWSAAWSAQAPDVYLSFYHKHYKPSNGMSRKSWEQSRRYRLKKPRWIKIALSDFNVLKNTGKQAVVSFKQAYRSNSYRDVSNKQMVLIYTDNGWRIYREKSL